MAKATKRTPSRTQTRRARRSAALAEQRRWISELLERGWSYSTIGQQLDLRPDTISRWHLKGIVARNIARSKIEAIYNSRKRPPIARDVEGIHGPVTHEMRQMRNDLAKEYGLYRPAERARKIRSFAKECGLSLPELARLLNIAFKTVNKYANPAHKAQISPGVLSAFIELMETHKSGAGLSRDAQFREVAQRLFGPYYVTGFTPGSPERVRVLNILESFTGYDRRSLYRYLPPEGGFSKRKLKPSFILIRKLEDIANLLEPSKSLLTTKRVLLSRRDGSVSGRSPVKSVS